MPRKEDLACVLEEEVDLLPEVLGGWVLSSFHNFDRNCAFLRCIFLSVL
ncbi:MAG: hypothetical protein ACTSRS_05755 [Candidatus Helarchaeota archaeon]